LRRRTSAAERDDGSASIWVLTCTALLVVITVAVMLRATAVLARHRAEAAADEAALAGASQIGVSDQLCPAAARIASANGARLADCVTDLAASGRSGTVSVEVAVLVTFPLLGTQTILVRARAARDPASGPG
jgi:secretion/DNA translocation related TadE-like protein